MTAVDWSKNVYFNQKINYPQEIIQLLYKERPLEEPYRDRNGIIIIEFCDLREILKEISKSISIHKKKEDKRKDELKDINEIIKNPQEETVVSFIDDVDFRSYIINTLAKEDVFLITGFLELFSKAIDKTWERSMPPGAFYAYDENLTILVEILINIELTKMPPALLESIVYNLDRVSYYIGTSNGKSRAAYRTWINSKEHIPKDTYDELINISNTRRYYRLNRLLRE